MRAIILAAGEGTRLRPLTDQVPKCMVPLLGRPLLDWQTAAWREAGVTDITVVTGYRRERVDAPKQLHNPAFATTNMVESLLCARSMLQEGRDTIVSYGDLAFEPRVARAAVQAAGSGIVADRGWEAYWRARMSDPLADAETFKLGPDGRIAELGKKPASLADIQGQYTGIIRLSGPDCRRLLDHYDRLPRDALYDGRRFQAMFMTSFLQSLIDSGWVVKPIWIDNGWLEVDTVEDLSRYVAMHGDGTLRRFFDPAAFGGRP